ncbi:MAG: tRNA lysidine(34) synthetase TilS [Chloroflexi bacterium]|nr:tRNA lysidine(34) synthetase TilS [Chloroflexota bacterium]
MDIPKVVTKVIKHNIDLLLPADSRVVVGVSGGMDSMALLHVLQTVWGKSHLIIAHFDHALRSSSGDDARFVEKTAVSLQLPFYLGKANAKEWSISQGSSVEEAGRELRYRFFVKIAKEVGATAVAVAHHADDQVETILMHLLRGSGLSGLRGMQQSRSFTEASGLLLIRPFLSIRRSAIADYCQTHQIAFREDESNDDITFFRNRIRHQLFPLLNLYSPQIHQRLRNMAEIVSADYDLLDAVGNETWQTLVLAQSDDWLRLDRMKWLSLPLSLKRMMLRKAVKVLRPLQYEIGFQTIEQARQLIEKRTSGAQAMLPGGLQLLVGSQAIAIATHLDLLPIDVPQLESDKPLTLLIPGQIPLQNGWRIEAEIMSTIDLQQIETNQDNWQAFVAIKNDALIVRPRHPGERFQPLGMNGHSTKLKDVMKNLKIPAALRLRWPIIATPEIIVWFVGHQIDERIRIDDKSTRIVHIKCYQNKEN